MTKPQLDVHRSAQYYDFAGKDVPWLAKLWAEQTPDKVFLVWEPRDGRTRTWTYQQFWQEINQVACGLIARGVTKGDKVLIHSDNCPEMMIAWYASAIVGSVAVTTNTRCIGEELTYFAEHSEAVGCITQPKFVEQLAKNATNLGWFVVAEDNSGEAATEEQLGHGQPTWDSLYTEGDEPPARPAEPMLPVGIQYTSGTTSRPKAVVHTHANALWGGRSGSQNVLMTSDDTYLVFLPCFHVNAQSWSFWSMMWVGGTVVLQPKFSSSTFWDLSLKHQVTRASMIPFCIKAISSQAVPEHSYKTWATGVKLHDIENHWKVTTFATWGMTETVTHATRGDVIQDSPEMNIGIPSPGYEFAIVDPETGELCPPGVNGDLWVRGTRGVQIFLEYFKNPEAMASSFADDGWFRSGDVARIGDDGYFYFGDRDKDILKVGGENVSASQVEGFVLGLFARGVLEAQAVVAQKHEMLGEVPVLFAVRSGHTTLTEEEIRTTVLQGCEEGLADFKRPREVYFLDELPRATLDKVAKNKLRDLANEMQP
ncbi:AMP-binding protein [Rhodococcus sp. X156]|uniref:class I adenylate-forming enzyme family protein n=1 Tax=Rhodococcus sp. X156 TaxID=2499145 RepID=UPI000FDA5CF2|nr:AMP-binding protein [Rhodococcus sp. X156]